MPKVKAKVDINSGTVAPTEKKRKLRASIWKIMINPHLTFPDLVMHADSASGPTLENYARNHAEFGQAYRTFKATLERMFGEDLENYIHIKEDGIEVLDDKYFNAPDAKIVLEYGQKNKQLHAQVYLRINHRTKISLKYDVMTKVIQDALGLEKPPGFSGSWISLGHSDFAELYLLKTT